MSHKPYSVRAAAKLGSPEARRNKSHFCPRRGTQLCIPSRQLMAWQVWRYLSDILLHTAIPLSGGLDLHQGASVRLLADLLIFIMRSYLKAQLTAVDFKQFGPYDQFPALGNRSEVLDVDPKADPSCSPPVRSAAQLEHEPAPWG
jgi:hypothetical protein